ncbi:hypothetical protein M3Y97_00672400 [Aphelenchoides bicaudatus]|nr:hypothetical protein M3Y97_00672400 [Aphelenchoides bicaudatus]
MPDDLPRIPNKRRPRNRPRNDAWLQQKQTAYRPIYTFRCALPIVLIYACICIGISIALYKNTLNSFEFVLDYTECHNSMDPNISHYFEGETLFCRYELTLPEVVGDVFFYYGLRNFYQNIRKYEQSRNDRQLAGHIFETDECYPLTTANKTGSPPIVIVPCGAVANSMFNDTFVMSYHIPEKEKIQSVPMTANKLIPNNVRNVKYKNPKKCTDEDKKCPGFEGTTKPPSWRVPIEELGNNDTGRALENFDFIQWMETAALPNFRKLYRKLDQLPGGIFADGLPYGNYTLYVQYNYNVSVWSGTKLFVIQADGKLGPKSFFQMYAFFGLGSFLFLFGCFMLLVEFGPPFNRKLS